MKRLGFQGAAVSLGLVSGICACDSDTGKEGPNPEPQSDEVDRIDAACTTAPRVLGECEAGRVTEHLSMGGLHVREPEIITYTTHPPSSGTHRPAWARWGEYDYLGPQRWLHNIEHGGIAFLYDPCVPETVVNDLRDFIASQPEDETGGFRYVLTPYPGLPTSVAAVSWQWTWEAECVHEGSLSDFVQEHYRQAPEDFATDGSYSTGWIAR